MPFPSEGALLASDLLVDSLDLLLGGNPHRVEIEEALPIENAQVLVRADALDILLGMVTGLLTCEHAARCPADQPPALINTIRAVTCATCVRTDDLRAAIRYARRPTRYAEELFADDEEYWLRVFALVGAASASHYDEPYGLAQVVLAEPESTRSDIG